MNPLETYGHLWTWREHLKPALVDSSRFEITSVLGKRCRFEHPFWVLEYAWNATQRFRVGTISAPWHDRPRNSLLILPYETVYWEEYARNQPPAVVAYAKFAWGDEAGLDEMIHPRKRYGLFLDPDGVTGALLEEMARIGHDSGERGFWRAYSAFSMLIARLRESEPVQAGVRRIAPSSPAPAPSAFVQAVDQYLAQNIARLITLADMARALNVSVSLLTHRFRREAGEPPRDRLLRLRLRQAKILIAAGQPLKVVAEATGFYDAFHLSHTFKQAEGLSPREFLNQIHGMHRPGH